jgi:thiol-disulfide isomerase/thioredoxin
MTDYRRLEKPFADDLQLKRRPVAVAFKDAPPPGVSAFTGTAPSGCTFWRLASEGRTFYMASTGCVGNRVYTAAEEGELYAADSVSPWLRVSAVMVMLCVALVSQPAAASIPWQTDIEKASASAVKIDKPILLEFWADWCPPCKVMDAEVYTDARVAEAMAKVMPVRVDVDKKEAIARKYVITSMPTLLFADSYGNELFRYTGTVTVDTMIQLMSELPADVATINHFARALAEDGQNFAALEGLARELRTAKFYRASNQYYGRALGTRAARQQAAARSSMLIAMGHNHLVLKEFSEAAKVFDRYLKDHPGAPAEAEAMLGLGRAQLFQNKRADAKRTLQALTNKYKSGNAYKEAARLLETL